MASMKRLAILCLLCSCGASASEINITISGVTASDIAVIQAELQKIPGLTSARAGQFKDGQVTFAVQFAGTGPELAGHLGRSTSGLKNVKSFETAAVLVSFDNASTPTPPPATQPTPPVSTERPANLPKDPLAYQIFKFNGGSIAKFDNWNYVPVNTGDGNMIAYDGAPQGREKDFLLRVVMGTPNQQQMQQLFTMGPQYVQQMLSQFFQGLQRIGESKMTKYGGDEAMNEEYRGTNLQGTAVKIRCVYIKKKDVAVAVFGIGPEAVHQELGRAIDIVAQSVTLQESPIEAGMTGTWVMNYHNSSGTGEHRVSTSSAKNLTIYPNGTFTEHGMTSTDGTRAGHASVEAQNRGRVVKRGNNLTFTYDDGKIWNATYELRGGALILNGNAWFRP